MPRPTTRGARPSRGAKALLRRRDGQHPRRRLSDGIGARRGVECWRQTKPSGGLAIDTLNTAADTLSVVWFVGLFLGLPLLGWLCMVLDIRAYYRSLRRALVTVRTYALNAPLWALRDRPDCLAELGLAPGCDRDEVMRAYRRRVKQVHPDHGGDRRRFDELQQHLRDALALVEAES